jgi:hypothetical protein
MLQCKSRWIDRVEEDARKMGCKNWPTAAQDRRFWLHMLDKAKVTQGCRADGDDDDDDYASMGVYAKKCKHIL